MGTHSTYRLRELETNRELAETLELHFIELPKFNRRRPHKRLGRFEMWIDLFRRASAYISGEEPLPAEFAVDETVKMAIKQVQKVNADEEMRQIIEGQERWEHNVASRLGDARDKGAAEKALEMATALIAEGVDLEIIQRASGLPLARLKELEKGLKKPAKKPAKK